MSGPQFNAPRVIVRGLPPQAEFRLRIPPADVQVPVVRPGFQQAADVKGDAEPIGGPGPKAGLASALVPEGSQARRGACPEGLHFRRVLLRGPDLDDIAGGDEEPAVGAERHAGDKAHVAS